MVFDADQVTAEGCKSIEKIQNASNLEELEGHQDQRTRVADSAMTRASKAIGSLPADQKKEAGKLMGKLRADFGRAYGPGGRAQGSRREGRACRRNRGYDAAGEP